MGIEDFFNSRSFAVVGASRDEGKVGNVIFKNLLENKRIMAFPVNPNASQVLGQRCYKDLLEIPYNLDCVIIVVKAESAPEVLLQAVKKGARCAVIISAGFSESGNSELEQEIKEIAQRNKISLLGPNCFGFINVHKKINTTFFEGIPEEGGIAFISQSGAWGAGILDIAMQEKIGFSGFVSLGNSACLDFSDFIEYFSEDRNTRVIAFYMESLKENKGIRFLEACKKCKKPIIAIKSGKSKKGELAAASHTSSLASEKGVYEGIFKQAGIIEVNSVSQLINSARVIDRYGKVGKRACIITNAGGLGVLCSDFCSLNSIDVPSLPNDIKERLSKILPAGWSRNNPIDILGEALAERYKQVIKLLEEEKWFDFFIVLLTPQHMTQPLETAEVLKFSKKPVFTCFYGGKKVEDAKVSLNEKIVNFRELEDLAYVLGRVQL